MAICPLIGHRISLLSAQPCFDDKKYPLLHEVVSNDELRCRHEELFGVNILVANIQKNPEYKKCELMYLISSSVILENFNRTRKRFSCVSNRTNSFLKINVFSLQSSCPILKRWKNRLQEHNFCQHFLDEKLLLFTLITVILMSSSLLLLLQGFNCCTLRLLHVSANSSNFQGISDSFIQSTRTDCSYSAGHISGYLVLVNYPFSNRVHLAVTF